MAGDHGTGAGPSTPPDGHYWERARRGPAPWVIGAVGLAALGAGQLIPVRHHMENDLRARSLAALRSAGLSGVSVTFSGRDGLLSGTVQSPADVARAVAAVRAQAGVRVATSDLHYALARPATISVVTAGGRVTLSGTLGSTAARLALVAAAVHTFGAGRVTDATTVAPGVSSAEVPGLGDLIAALGAGSAATAQLRGGVLTLDGTVTGQEAVTAAVHAAAGITGAAGHVVNGLRIAAPAAPTSTAGAGGSTAGAGTGAGGTDAVAVQRALDALTQIGFGFASTEPTASGQAAVERAARILVANPGVGVRVEGYTDDVGDWRINKVLSVARAETVRRLLVQDGVAPGRLTVFGWSKDDPKVPNTSVANRAINRRVEFRVLT